MTNENKTLAPPYQPGESEREDSRILISPSRLWALRAVLLVLVALLAYGAVTWSRNICDDSSRSSLDASVWFGFSALLYLIMLVASFLRRRPNDVMAALRASTLWPLVQIGFLMIGHGLSSAYLFALGVPQIMLFFAALQCLAETRPLPRISFWHGYGESVVVLAVIGGILYLTAPSLLPNRMGNPAVGSLRLILNCAVDFQTRNSGKSFPSGLSPMGPNGDGCLDAVLTNVANGGPQKNGYTFTYTPGEPNQEGIIEGFTANAQPFERGRTGCRSLFVDETGVVRYTQEDRPATKDDPPLS